MSKLNRQKQHKPPRETAKSRELADLRRENHKLKQQVARTRKQAVRAIDAHFPLFSGVNRSTAPKPEMKGCVLTREVLRDAAEKMLNACPCGGNWKRLELGPKVIEVCDQCTARRPVKSDPI
jgi:hypothetical protein